MNVRQLSFGTDTDRPRPRSEPLPPHQPLSETSRAAAESMRRLVPTARERVFAVLIDRALTDEEISQTTGLAPNTVRPRRVELVREGRIAKVGRRPTESGRMADTWRANPEAV